MNEKSVAEFMINEILEKGYVYQEYLVHDIQKKFGEEYVYVNENGNLAISKKVLNEFKKLKDGSSNRHVYYFCTKSQNQKCTLGYINEINLIKNLQSLIDKIDFNKIALQNKIKEELDRFKKFQSILLNRTDNTNFKEIDVREYVKWVLKGGTIEEKRELISSFKVLEELDVNKK